MMMEYLIMPNGGVICRRCGRYFASFGEFGAHKRWWCGGIGLEGNIYQNLYQQAEWIAKNGDEYQKLGLILLGLGVLVGVLLYLGSSPQPSQQQKSQQQMISTTTTTTTTTTTKKTNQVSKKTKERG